MVMMTLPFLTLDEQIRLAQLGNTGQMEFMYTTNPEDKPGKDLHVVVVRDEHGHVTQDGKLTTPEFRALLMSTLPRDPAPAALSGPATYGQVRRAGLVLEHFDTIAFGLRGTSPSANGRHLDTWERRRAKFAEQWASLDSAARREQLAEVRAVLFEFHGTDEERKANAVPTLSELHDREIRSPGRISNSVRR